MEDSFSVRVEKIFGALSSSPSSSSSSSLSSLSSLRRPWCLTDEELERREWNRDKGSPDTQPPPCPSNFDAFFGNHPTPTHKRSQRLLGEELDDDLQEDLEDDDDSRAQSLPPDGTGSTANDEEWEIRSSIGLDPTLDNEEEEDDCDKVAVGKENSTDRLYMNGIHDYGVDVNSYKVLPDSFKETMRDPRANHMAARIRLKEDAEAAKNFNSLQVSAKTAPVSVDTKVETSENGGKLKPILKRKETQMMKSEKRVRFDPDCKTSHEKESAGDKDAEMETSSMEEAATSQKELGHNNNVPDYIQNPSKYTCYTLDVTSEVDEMSNRHAYMDFLNQLKKSKGIESPPDDTCSELPKSVTFTPKKKTGSDAAVMMSDSSKIKQDMEDVEKEEPMQRKALSISIAVEEEDAQEGEACMMDEDDAKITVDKDNSTRKAVRQYRRKDRFELEETIP